MLSTSTSHRRIASLACLTLALVAASASAEAPDKTLSPYFASPGSDSRVESLPLESTRSDAYISGVIAHVTVKQRYRNRGDKPIEAVYVFPGSTRSAVYGMTMKVGARIIKADIQERDAARKMYEAAKAQGKTASLLEQERPNVFSMNVANILPNDVIEVELDYAELLVPTAGEYELVIPGVVGPRYTTTPAEGAAPQDKFTSTPYQHAGKAPAYDWDATVRIDAGVPIVAVASPSHKLDQKVDGHDAMVRIADGERTGDRDFVLHYALRGAAVGSGLLLFPGHDKNDEKFFLLNVQPPAAMDDAAIPDREYVFIVDVSGSMHGFPIDTAKVLMNDLLSGLKPSDKYNILTFSGGSETLADRSLSASPENVAKGLKFMSRYGGGGGTEIVPALKTALAMPADESLSRVFVVVTDGYVSVEAEAFDLIRNNLGKANLFSFGIGSSVNRFLIDGMARAGGGEPFVVLNANDAEEQVSKLQAMIASPALTRVRVEYSGFDAYDVEPAAIPDLFAEKPVIVFGKYRGEPKGTITVRGFTGKGKFEQKIDVSRVTADEDNEALPVLWARHRIARLADDQKLHNNEENKKAVTDLGLKYSLMTAYTSFIAIDQKVRSDGTLEKVQQPLPMPAGVEDTAVGDGGLVGTQAGTMGFKGTGSGGGGVGYGRGIGGAVMPSSAPPPMAMRPQPAKMMESRRMIRQNAPKDEEESAQDAPSELVVSVASVEGTLTAAQARSVVQKLRAALACLAKNGSGQVVLEIDASGKVVGISPSAATGFDLGAACVSTGLKSVAFPASAGTTRVTLRIVRM